MMFLFHFGAKRKTLSLLFLLFVTSVMLQYKPKIKDLSLLIDMQKVTALRNEIEIEIFENRETRN